MGFGGSASAANAAIKRNAALRNNRSFLGEGERKWKHRAGFERQAQLAERVKFREQLALEMAADRRWRIVTWVLILIALYTLIVYFF
ncbi:hypothetical protein CLV84_2039 [Neolewinella xylanilytica]|uniref:Uncharacterized protein n=1 Tax=Neolewinella xylanilytica TaxID=1514080 RepID=A0A2S6I1T7_9BACT|nr:hypothetical protein [Neolewinella xylanilytica]PPK85147.1 hypothetical protein CLV84_2039 [Neolewinella xylanilytica]